MAGSWDYVKAFKKNCPTVHLSQDDEEELRRLFWSAMEHAKTKLATSPQKPGADDG